MILNICRFASLDDLEADGINITRFTFPEKASIEDTIFDFEKGTW